MLYHGNSLQILKQLEDNSVDSVVTDPPYGLSFMGKKWDYDVPSTDLWREVYRVLKPGGHLLAFAGTRTQHRMAVNIEDAGFEIRDMIAWVYGSGFPKSLNIGKAVDKLQGNERVETGRVTSVTGNRTTTNTHQNTGKWAAGLGKQAAKETKGTSEWEGWGTALKPALEPITVARKPISEKNIAENVLKWGTGGINIDESRVGTEQVEQGRRGRRNTSTFMASMEDTGGFTQGRFPANFIHDGSDEVTELFPTTSASDSKRTRNTVGSFGMPNDSTPEYADKGSAARYFYCAKASKSERNKGLEGFRDVEQPKIYADDKWSKENMGNTPAVKREPVKNNHPTVKPVKLMQYLVRLVTPKGGTVLDPFMGSGTTGIACKLEGFKFIGIEREAEYIEIAKARIIAWELSAQEKLL